MSNLVSSIVAPLKVLVWKAAGQRADKTAQANSSVKGAASETAVQGSQPRPRVAVRPPARPIVAPERTAIFPRKQNVWPALFKV